MTQVEAATRPTLLERRRATVAGDSDPLNGLGPELFGYCYRMLGSAADADDAVQETMVRAWRGRDGFAGEGPLEAWLYRIATNVCLNLLRSRRRRALPMDVVGASSARASLGSARANELWIEPLPHHLIGRRHDDPGDKAVMDDSIRLAFVAALQTLPPRQRAILILREVLGWRAREVADLLDMSEVSVKSALQRARATLAERPARPAEPMDRELLDGYLDAFRRYDIDALVALLHEDATLSMPPFDLWLQGRTEIGAWLVAHTECRNSVLVPIAVNGTLGFTQHRPGADGSLEPFSITVLEHIGGQISEVHAFIDPTAVTQLALTGGR